MKSWLQENSMEIYSAYNEGKIVVAERFIFQMNKIYENLMNEIYKYMNSVSKNLQLINTLHIPYNNQNEAY